MNKSIEQLAKQHADDSAYATGEFYKSIDAGLSAGMTVPEVVDALNFPKTMDNPYRALASVALGKYYGVSMEKAYGIYPYLKEGKFPNMADEEIVEQLFASKEELPEPQKLKKEFYAKKAEKTLEEFPAYAEKRQEAETDAFDKVHQGLLQSRKSFEKQTKPAIKENVRKQLEREWGGKGTNRNVIALKFLDAYYNAGDSKEKQKEAMVQYLEDLRREQDNRHRHFERLAYQIENHTEDETFWERKALAWERNKLRGKGTLANMANSLALTVAKIVHPGTGQDEMIEFKHGRSFPQYMQDIMIKSYMESTSPELWREELNWWDGATNAIIENTSTIGIAAAAATIGGLAAGPVGAKLGVFLAVGAAESYEMWAACDERGYSPEERNRRATIGFVLTGLIEVAGGGVTKYAPKFNITKRILGAGGRFGKNQLTELLEELGQEGVSALLTDSVPYNKDGTINYSEVANQILLLARDTATLATLFGTAQSGMNKLAAYKARTKLGMDAKSYEAFAAHMESNTDKKVLYQKENDDVDKALWDYIVGEEEQEIEGEEFPGQQKYSKETYIAAALKEEMMIGEMDNRKLDLHPYLLVPNTDKESDMKWHIKNFKDPKHNLEFETYKEAFAKYQELVPPDVWQEKVYAQLEQLPSELAEPLKAKTPSITEPLSHIKNATRFNIVQVGPKEFIIRDASTGEVPYDPMTLHEAMDAKDKHNINVDTKDPLIKILWFARSRADNQAGMEVYHHITKMLDNNSTAQQRKDSTQKLSNYVSDLRSRLMEEYTPAHAEEMIPRDLESQLSVIPGMWEKGRVIHTRMGKELIGPHLGFVKGEDRNNAAKLIRKVIRLNQMYGMGTQADLEANWIRSFIKKVKPNKRIKPVVKAEDAQKGLLETIWDGTLGVTKDDFITSLTFLLGQDHIPLAMDIINGRQQASGISVTLNEKLRGLKDNLKLDDNDLRDWSKVLAHKGHKHPMAKININGTERHLTLSQLIYLDIAMQDKNLRDIIQTNGVAFNRKYDLGPMTEAEQIALAQTLAENPEAESFAVALRDFYINELGEYRDIGSMELNGYSITTEETYMPGPMVSDTGALVIQDAAIQVIEDIRSTSNYAGIAPMIRKVKDLINNKAFRAAVREGGRMKHLTRFQEQMEAMSTASPQQMMALEKLLNRIGANKARSILANLRIAALQFGSIQLYMNETSLKHLKPVKVPQSLFDSWDLLQQRKERIGSTHAVVSETSTRKVWFGKDPMSDYALAGMHGVDLAVYSRALPIAWNELQAARNEHLTGPAVPWYAQYLQGDDPGSLEPMSPEFIKTIHDRASYLGYTTQPMFFPESRNAYTTSGKSFLMELARFRSFTDQLLRNNARQIALWQQGEISGREAFTHIAHNMWFASVWYNGIKYLLGELWEEITPGEKYDEDENDIRNLLVDFVLGPISWIPFVGWSIKTGLDEFAKGESRGPAPFSTITFAQLRKSAHTVGTISKAIKYSAEGDEEKAEKYWKKGMRQSAEDTLIYLGLPDWPIDLIPEPEEEKPTSKKSYIQKDIKPKKKKGKKKKGGSYIN